MPSNPGFDINGIRENAYWFREPKTATPENEELSFSIEHSFNVRHESSVLEIATTIEIRREPVENNTKKSPLLHYEVSFQFGVEGIDFTAHPDEDPEYEYIQLPKGFAAALAGTVYSTCRGLLFARTAGSQLHNYLLPITNSASMVDDMNDRLRKKKAVKHISKEEPKAE